jgi:endoglucanase
LTDSSKSFLLDLIQLPGLSAYEKPVRERISAEWDPLVDQLTTSRMGSLHGLKQGTFRRDRPSILLAAHMDAIGLMVSEVVDGYLRVTQVGGLDPRVLPGQPVVIHGRENLDGVIVQPPAHTLPEGDGKGVVQIKHLLVDSGLSNREIRKLIRPGDLISFAQQPIELDENLIVGHSMDNRASLAALSICLHELQSRQHGWDLIVAATVQEEETMVGALTSAFELKPTIAVAVDVTWARQAGLPEHQTFPLGDGPTNGWGPNIHPKVHGALKNAAEAAEIPLTTEYMARHSGTDAYSMQVAGEGIPTGMIGIPLKSMHTPVEMVSMKDIRRTGRLLAQFISGLSQEFPETLTWD